MAQVDLANEVLRKLISEDKLLKEAVEKSAKKFVSSDDFSKAVTTALKEAIVDQVESVTRAHAHSLREEVLKKMRKYQAQVLNEYLRSPGGKKQVMNLITDALSDSNEEWIWDALADQGFQKLIATVAVASFKQAINKGGLTLPNKPKKNK